METHAQRVTRFFLQSIHSLKKESGGQRWNEICEDTAELALKHSVPGTKETVWQLFFYPPATLQESELLQSFANDDTSVRLQFMLLEALTDPPSCWWQTQMS